MSFKNLYALATEGSTWTVPQNFDVTFNWDYEDGRAGMMGLYAKGKEMQWDAATRIDWSQDLSENNPQGMPEESLPIHAAGCYQRMSEMEKGVVRRNFQAWQISQFMQGEQGALICAAKIVTQVPDVDSKFYAATQTIDEARHVEAYAKLLAKFGVSYPMTPPLQELIDTLSGSVDAKRFFVMPMLFWINASDAAIQVVCWVGAALSVLLFLNRLPRLCLLLLYVLYLSLLYGGQDFMTFQWDTFLLETGFLALLMSFAERPGIWLLRWLLFRFLFMSGMVKLLSDDPNWRNLTALSYHFLTQPLPTPLAWYGARLPAPLLQFGTAALFFIELVLPVLIFGPRRLRFVAAFGILLLQSLILLTGNYNWFNLQCMLLCLPLFDDAAVLWLLPRGLIRAAPLAPRVRRTAGKFFVAAVTVLIVFCSAVQMDVRFGGDAPVLARAVEELIEPFHVVNSYGLFAVMTTQRDEIVIEGSNDGVEWREYEFRYKPGNLSRPPPWNIPHQPRLDWQMWFAALDDPRRIGWFQRFLRRVLQNEPSVIALMERNPFPDRPPTYVRALFYDYTYASAAEKSQGIWWDRRLLGLYFPVARLKAE